MTIIGIAGCTALLVTGLGLRDSLNDVIPNQYEKTYLAEINDKYNRLHEDNKQKIRFKHPNGEISTITSESPTIGASSIEPLSLINPVTIDLAYSAFVSTNTLLSAIIVTIEAASLPYPAMFVHTLLRSSVHSSNAPFSSLFEGSMQKTSYIRTC